MGESNEQLVRDAIDLLGRFGRLGVQDGPTMFPGADKRALTALDALVAERDEALRDAVSVREKMHHNAANLEFAIQQRDEARIIAKRMSRTPAGEFEALAARADRVTELEAALREIEVGANLLGGLIQYAESPQGSLVGSIRKRARAALAAPTKEDTDE